MARTVLALALILALVTAPATARVFTRWSGREHLADTLTALGGRSVYTAPIRLNGADADLDVFSLDRPLPELLPELRRALAPVELGSDDATLLVTAITGATAVTRLVLAQPDPLAPTVAFAIRQSPEAYAQSAAPGSFPMPPGLETPPDATPRFSAEDGRTQTRFGLAELATPAADAQTALAAQFAAAGWHRLTPSESAPGALQVFAKADDICLFALTPLPATGGATITLLHKRMGMK